MLRIRMAHRPYKRMKERHRRLLMKQALVPRPKKTKAKKRPLILMIMKRAKFSQIKAKIQMKSKLVMKAGRL